MPDRVRVQRRLRDRVGCPAGTLLHVVQFRHIPPHRVVLQGVDLVLRLEDPALDGSERGRHHGRGRFLADDDVRRGDGVRRGRRADRHLGSSVVWAGTVTEDTAGSAVRFGERPGGFVSPPGSPGGSAAGGASRTWSSLPATGSQCTSGGSSKSRMSPGSTSPASWPAVSRRTGYLPLGPV